MAAIWHRLSRQMFAPVDIASLVCFRIAFGAILLWEVWRYFDHGWIERYWIAPNFHFTYYGFGWLRPWPGEGMQLHFLALGGLALCLALGLAYRLCAALFCAGFTYVFLLDQANHLNHFYLICLLSFLLIFVPAHRALSLDVLRHPGLTSATSPAWALWLLRGQVGIVYFFGGLAKLNGDWLRGEPMRMWLAERTDFPLIGELFTQEWVVYLFSYGGLLFDLLVVPLLLWHRTRLWAFALAVLFHACNAMLFQIGIFPWFMLAATLLFFPPAWPRGPLSLWERVGVRARRQTLTNSTDSPPSHRYLVTSLLVVYLLVQLLVPLRHWLYPGNVNWTEEGHRFAWHMKLRSKRATARFFAHDPVKGTTREIDPRLFLTRRQFAEMSTRPDMLLQFGHYVARELRLQGHDQIEVRAEVLVSLNGRPPQPLIDPTVDLAAQPRTLWPATWIVPLTETSKRERRWWESNPRETALQAAAEPFGISVLSLAECRLRIAE